MHAERRDAWPRSQPKRSGITGARSHCTPTRVPLLPYLLHFAVSVLGYINPEVEKYVVVEFTE